MSDTKALKQETSAPAKDFENLAPVIDFEKEKLIKQKEGLEKSLNCPADKDMWMTEKNYAKGAKDLEKTQANKYRGNWFGIALGKVQNLINEPGFSDLSGETMELVAKVKKHDLKYADLFIKLKALTLLETFSEDRQQKVREILEQDRKPGEKTKELAVEEEKKSNVEYLKKIQAILGETKTRAQAIAEITEKKDYAEYLKEREALIAEVDKLLRKTIGLIDQRVSN